LPFGQWGPNDGDDLEIPSAAIFWLTSYYISFICNTLFSGYYALVRVKHSGWDFVMRSAGWFLTMFQTQISIAITKFFLENIRPSLPH
jgi:hypothetical protein